MSSTSKTFEIAIVVGLQISFFVLFCVFARYDERFFRMVSYPMFQDIHVMMFVGFGFLMTFLRRYGFSAVGFNFLLGALIIQWAALCQGFYELNEDYKIQLSIQSLYRADIAAASVMISMGAVLGTTSYLQLLIMGVIEIAVFSANSYLGMQVFQATDAGGSIFVHTFGAYFGLAVSYILGRQQRGSQSGNSLEGSRYTSDLFAMIGTIFLWVYWPSFNAVELEEREQNRAVINTYLALASCCVTTFAVSLFLSHENKFEMVHIQNSTLAGGVAVGTCSNLMLQPYGAILVGIAAAILSVYGYSKLTPWLNTKWKLHDTCGVHNLHGMPGVLAGLIGALMAGIATETTYDDLSLYRIFPARAGFDDARSAGEQAGYQILALVVTMFIAITSGVITGFILSFPKIAEVTSINFYNDSTFWSNCEEAGIKEHSDPTIMTISTSVNNS